MRSKLSIACFVAAAIFGVLLIGASFEILSKITTHAGFHLTADESHEEPATALIVLAVVLAPVSPLLDWFFLDGSWTSYARGCLAGLLFFVGVGGLLRESAKSKGENVVKMGLLAGGIYVGMYVAMMGTGLVAAVIVLLARL